MVSDSIHQNLNKWASRPKLIRWVFAPAACTKDCPIWFKLVFWITGLTFLGFLLFNEPFAEVVGNAWLYFIFNGLFLFIVLGLTAGILAFMARGFSGK